MPADAAGTLGFTADAADTAAGLGDTAAVAPAGLSVAPRPAAVMVPPPAHTTHHPLPCHTTDMLQPGTASQSTSVETTATDNIDMHLHVY